MLGFQESQEWGIAGVSTEFFGFVESSGWGGVKRETSHLHSQPGVGGWAVKAAQEVKRVPAAPGRVATSEAVMCKLQLLSAKWILLFHRGKRRPRGVEFAMPLLVHSFEGSPVFNPAPSSIYFLLDPDFKELNIIEVDLAWCGFLEL